MIPQKKIMLRVQHHTCKQNTKKTINNHKHLEKDIQKNNRFQS